MSEVSGGQVPVQLLLVEHATLPVECHHLGPEPVRGHLLFEVLRDVGADGADSFRGLDKDRHLRRFAPELVLVLFGESCRQFVIGRFDCLLIDVQIHQARLEVQLFRRVVSNRIAEVVPAEVAVLIDFRPEGVERVSVGFVDRSPCHAEVERVRKCLAHLPTELTLLRTVCLVDHDDDVIAIVEYALRLAELEDGGDDHLPDVLGEQVGQLCSGVCAHQVGHLDRVERPRNLGVEVDAVDHHEHGRVRQSAV